LIIDKFGLEVEIIKGSGGVFNVKLHEYDVDTTLLFSKHIEGRFPNVNEIEEKLKKWINNE